MKIIEVENCISWIGFDGNEQCPCFMEMQLTGGRFLVACDHSKHIHAEVLEEIWKESVQELFQNCPLKDKE